MLFVRRRSAPTLAIERLANFADRGLRQSKWPARAARRSTIEAAWISTSRKPTVSHACVASERPDCVRAVRSLALPSMTGSPALGATAPADYVFDPSARARHDGRPARDRSSGPFSAAPPGTQRAGDDVLIDEGCRSGRQRSVTTLPVFRR